MKPAASIVIRAYNEAGHLEKLFTGIRLQSVQDVQVILVDSGSTDGTGEIAARNGAEIVHILPEEFTFGRSLNRGIAAAQADLVVIASAHVYPVYPDWIEKLLAPLTGAGAALSYGKQRGGETTQFSEEQIFHQWYPDAPQPRQPHPFCNNANAAIRRDLWEQHAYDETLSGLEDLAWARWAFEQGLPITYVPEAEIIHVHRETPRGVYNRYRREGMAFKQIYPQEQFRLGDFARLFTKNAASDLHEAARQKVLGRWWRGILWFRWMQFSGTYQGYRQSGPLTWQLKQAFYYPRPREGIPLVERDVAPIPYPEQSHKTNKLDTDEHG
ncbi:MAG TPA: glycosyltransferase [Anaerolineaceae bacterium]